MIPEIKDCVVVIDHPTVRKGVALVTGVKMIKPGPDWKWRPCFELTYEDEEVDYIAIDDQHFLQFFDMTINPAMAPAKASLSKLVPYAVGTKPKG